MPEMWFSVRWPDDTERSYYSPSLVVHDHLTVNAEYPVDDFVDRSTTAMAEASERVRAKFGFACTSAAETATRIREDAARVRSGDSVTDGTPVVHITSLREVLQ
ncbi:MSMEG_0570 family nitrogen starvation response protein [Corynebacterium variabile]|uniref:MSMEG_0570 family nitrogen starvation response protein n=1 Tax=Corynebacterium variabile TaxID=1727 RepID=UPI003FCF0F0A